MDGGVGPLGGKKRSVLRGERGVHLSGRGGGCPKSERPDLDSPWGVGVVDNDGRLSMATRPA